jgi:lipoprotein NlpD
VPAVSVPPAVDADVPAETHPVPLPLAPTVETRSLDSPPAGASAPADTAAPSVDKPAAAAAPAGVAAAGPMAVSPGASGATSSSAPTAAAAGAAASVAGVAPAPTSSWVWPVDGRVLAKFDPVRGKGIDIGAAEDAPVRAVADGEVSYTGSPLDYGNLVILTHGNGLRTVYAHNKSILAKQGQTVSRGQIIATAGKTSVAAPVVHFEVRLKGVPVDPLEYLPVR